MLTFDQLDALTDPIIDLYEEYQQSVINDIARRLSKAKMTSTAAWQMQRLTESGKVYENALEELARVTGKSEAELNSLTESGKVYENALEELARVTGKSEAELNRLFARTGVKAIAFDDAIYKAAGLNPVPLSLSPAMVQVLLAGLRKTQGVMRNLTLTTALAAQNAFIDAADLAYMQITQGAMSYDQAIRAAVKEVANNGLSIISFGNRQEQLDVAMRRTVLTGVSQTVGNLQLARADEMGQDLVEVSAHIGARNKGTGPMNHESWQGQIYSRSGTHPKYKPFVETTGYGTVIGLHGANCRHSFFPYFEGISESAYKQAELDSFANKTVTYRGKEISIYDATQEQRAIERKIRYWKRQAAALEAASRDNVIELAKVRDWQARMRAFIKETRLSRQRIRELI